MDKFSFLHFFIYLFFRLCISSSTLIFVHIFFRLSFFAFVMFFIDLFYAVFRPHIFRPRIFSSRCFLVHSFFRPVFFPPSILLSTNFRLSTFSSKYFNRESHLFFSFNTCHGLRGGRRRSVTRKRGAFNSARRLETAIAALVFRIGVALFRPARP